MNTKYIKNMFQTLSEFIPDVKENVNKINSIIYWTFKESFIFCSTRTIDRIGFFVWQLFENHF